jgi:hypothetical protein
MMDAAPTDEVIKGIIAAQADNLNTPQALSILKVWINACEMGSTGGKPGELSRAVDALLGIAL